MAPPSSYNNPPLVEATPYWIFRKASNDTFLVVLSKHSKLFKRFLLLESGASIPLNLLSILNLITIVELLGLLGVLNVLGLLNLLHLLDFLGILDLLDFLNLHSVLGRETNQHLKQLNGE